MTAVILSPRDGMFLKDGREWATSQEGRAHSLAWPMPSTLLGALVTARGRVIEAAGAALAPSDWEALAGQTVLGPNIALRRPVAAASWTREHRVWPVPSDALFLGEQKAEGKIVRLDPRPPAYHGLGRDNAPARDALWWPRVDDQAKPAPAPQWWSEPALVEWLADPKLERDCAGDFRGVSQPRRFQAHVGIDPETLAARESILFAHDIVETLDGQRCEWAIGCQVDPVDDGLEYATLGGDRRLARIERVSDELFAMPDGLRAAFERQASPGLRLVAVTPAVFKRGWLPDGFAHDGNGALRGKLPAVEGEMILRAALVPRPTHVSGWDMANNRPKPTTRLVPPGAVYHFVRADAAPFSAADAARLWSVALGDRTRHGFGRFVPGLWPVETA
jgi:CRISPR-associated protein Cmr3